ncbi:MAG: hypothetical protein COS92_07980 [Desulfobacterales bacterium CG07_land_8_20_14_0_80_52_14]|nr:MAG: hypothetical protein COS92_07980 [Desulfobacterales bacterium CG07_land_8_20_14_0_80_52_14]
MNATTRIFPWHLGQVKGSTSFTRLNRVPFGKFNRVNLLDHAGPNSSGAEHRSLLIRACRT